MQYLCFVVGIVALGLTGGAVWAPGAELSGVLVVGPAVAVASVALALCWPWLSGGASRLPMPRPPRRHDLVRTLRRALGGSR